MDFNFVTSPSHSPEQSMFVGNQYFESTSEGSSPDSPRVRASWLDLKTKHVDMGNSSTWIKWCMVQLQCSMICCNTVLPLLHFILLHNHNPRFTWNILVQVPLMIEIEDEDGTTRGSLMIRTSRQFPTCIWWAARKLIIVTLSNFLFLNSEDEPKIEPPNEHFENEKKDMSRVWNINWKIYMKNTKIFFNPIIDKQTKCRSSIYVFKNWQLNSPPCEHVKMRHSTRCFWQKSLINLTPSHHWTCLVMDLKGTLTKELPAWTLISRCILSKSLYDPTLCHFQFLISTIANFGSRIFYWQGVLRSYKDIKPSQVIWWLRLSFFWGR